MSSTPEEIYDELRRAVAGAVSAVDDMSVGQTPNAAVAIQGAIYSMSFNIALALQTKGLCEIDDFLRDVGVPEKMINIMSEAKPENDDAN